MAEISLCMIVKNEAACLARCLESVQGAVDEIIILDTGSTDGTQDIARRFTSCVYDYVWDDDFAAARNASFSYATKPYILWLDADDVLQRSEREKLITLKARLNGVDAVMMPYYSAFLSDGTPSLIYDRERIVRRDAGFAFAGVVHEAMEVSGRVIREDIVVRHMQPPRASGGQRNLAIYEKWIARGRPMSARDQYYYARELLFCGEPARAEQAFQWFLAMDGWVENRIDAHVQLSVCLLLQDRAREALSACLPALALCVPRAQMLCQMGACCMALEDWHAAIFWYRAAMIAKAPQDFGAFVEPDAGRYIPAIQLCVCYDRLGDLRTAAQMNEQALLFHPEDAAALQNRAYFTRRLAEGA